MGDPVSNSEYISGSDYAFLDNLAAGTPVPGGGSASAYAGAMGAALVAMVARLSQGKKKYAEVEPRMEEIETAAEDYRKSLTEAVAKDSAAFTAVMTAYKMPKDSPEEKLGRSKAIQNATLQAVMVPLEVAASCVNLISLAAEVAEKGNKKALADAGAGAALARAAYTGAAMNVQINLFSLEDQEKVAGFSEQLKRLKKQSELSEHVLQKALHDNLEKI